MKAAILSPLRPALAGMTVALLGLGGVGFVQAAEVEGRLAFADRTALSTPVEGVIETLSVRPGERVEAGTVLMALDETPFRLRQQMISAEIPGLKRAAAEAELDAERVQALYDRTSASDSEREVALIERDRARGERDRGQAEYGLRGWEREQATLEAPFDARVLAVHASPGEVISPRLTPPVLIEIARADRLVASAVVDADRLGDIELGDEMTVMRGGERRSGSVEAIAAEHDQQDDVRYRVSVGLDTDGLDWRAGQRIEIDFPGN
ncbi:MAG: efflux RND transporter periplasmic adaptor subunit [Guyparkeria sp.]|uniref:efflux RND transporter periplasmic adaptor subunit n=1 Tax=Guyparkeria sp. TaxID=2035736 RepID=UPI00397D8485